MRSSAAMIAHDGIESDSLPAFLSDLSALCRKHGSQWPVGITLAQSIY
jgi:hypothetical protein